MAALLGFSTVHRDTAHPKFALQVNPVGRRWWPNLHLTPTCRYDGSGSAGRSRIGIGLPILWFCRAAQAAVQAYELSSIQFRKCWLHSDLEIAGQDHLSSQSN